MPIRRFLDGPVFDPEALAGMSDALMEACRAVGRNIADDAETRAIARRIVEAARHGERNPEKLKAAALEKIRH
jgi:hypothetical protein